MAIVVYKCDVCKRDIELERNIRGLENIQRCTITHGCRGKLYQTKVLPDFVRGRLPTQVEGLSDWQQRKVLYNHNQTIERETWSIPHNLGTFPSISVFINTPTEADASNQEEVIPTDTIIVDEDNIILKFDKALAGLAQLVARQSDPNLLNTMVSTAVTVEELQQLSLNGDITIATRTSSISNPDDVNITIEYTTTTNAVVSNTYAANNNEIGTASSWSDIKTVLIKGKTYTIRTFNGIFTSINEGTIGSGSTFKFANIAVESSPGFAPRSIDQDEVYLLFANSPYEAIDKITTQYIDIYDTIISDNNFTLVYDTGEFFADKEIIQNVYPPIRNL